MKEQNVSGGWLTAEYSMLPYSTGGGRKSRDISRGKLDGRSSEIQRLIGRSLRAVVDLKKLNGHTVWVDCDVLQADGGTRTASITGASVACAVAFERMVADSKLRSSPLNEHVSAVSCGVYEKEPVLDLCYLEDRDASVDFNIVLTEGGEFVELQGSGEEATFSETEMSAMLALGKKGALEIVELQRAAVLEALGDAGVRAGLPRDAAYDLAFHTVRGAAQLAIDSGRHPAALKDQVTSPGGTTIAGLERLEAGGLRAAVYEAVAAATARSRELGGS